MLEFRFHLLGTISYLGILWMLHATLDHLCKMQNH